MLKLSGCNCRLPVKFRRSACFIAAFAALAFVGAVRADSVENEVLNFSGATYAVKTFDLTNTSTQFAVVGVPGGGFSPTGVDDPNEVFNNGTFSLNIDLTGAPVTVNDIVPGFVTDYEYDLTSPGNDNTANDFLTEQIYVGSDLQDVFRSADAIAQSVAFGKVVIWTPQGNLTQYWFAFIQALTTPAGKGGDTIGGYIYINPDGSVSDVKTFDISAAPAPTAALGGLFLMAALGVKRLSSRLFKGRLLPMKIRV
jgi:hypothetical protein